MYPLVQLPPIEGGSIVQHDDLRVGQLGYFIERPAIGLRQRVNDYERVSSVVSSVGGADGTAAFTRSGITTVAIVVSL
jgi:hypothetical protein